MAVTKKLGRANKRVRKGPKQVEIMRALDPDNHAAEYGTRVALNPLDVFGSAIGALVKLAGGRWAMPRNLIPNDAGTIHYELTPTELVFTMKE